MSRSEPLPLRLAADSIDLQIWVLSDPETYSFANTAHASFHGRSPASFDSARVVEVWGISPMTDRLIALNRKIVSSRETLRTEEWVSDTAGTRHLLEITRTPVSVPGERLPSLVCTATDITSRLRLEQQLSGRENLYGIVVEQSRDGIYVYHGSTFRFVNDRLCEMLGYDREELLSLKVESLIHPDDRDRVRSYGSARSRGPGAPERYQARVVTSDGDIRDLDFSVARISFDGDVAAVGTVRDVTGQKTAQRRLDELTRRTVRMDKLLSVGDLAGGIAHDFNNLLTGILGNIQLAGKGCSPESQEHLAAAGAICREAAELTGQLLVFASGGDPIRSPIPVNDPLREVTKEMIPGGDIATRFDLPDDLMHIVADRMQLVQVLRNLISNAVHAMPGGGELSVSAENVMSGDVPPGIAQRSDGYVMISIRDTGEGIDDENLPRVFDPFFTTTSDHPGAGLGLSIVYSVVRKHEGFVTVDSKKGEGTCFRLYFPAVGYCEFNPDLPPVEEGAHLGSILLMDDEEMIRMVVGEMLEASGFETCTASDGLEAYETYRMRFGEGRPFDVVILDLTVTDGIGGEESIELIRGLDPGAKVIVSSGYSNSPVMSRYAEHGFSEVLRKPYTINEIRETVLRVLKS